MNTANTFIDTAGIRRKSKVDDRIEKFSVMRAQLAIERADVCIIMLDARRSHGAGHEDSWLAHEAGKASPIVVNKWDLVEKDGKTMDKLRQARLPRPRLHELRARCSSSRP